MQAESDEQHTPSIREQLELAARQIQNSESINFISTKEIYMNAARNGTDEEKEMARNLALKDKTVPNNDLINILHATRGTDRIPGM